MAAWKHGLRASVVTDAEALRYQLGPEVLELLEQNAREAAGDPSAPDLELALGMARKRIIFWRLFNEIRERGVAINEPIFNPEGKKIGVRFKVNPLLKAYLRISGQIGCTVDALLSRRSQAQDARDSTATAALVRDARLRAVRELAVQVEAKKI